MTEQANSLIQKFRHHKGTLVSLLQDIQEEYSYLPKEVLEQVAQELEIPLANIYGVATFYAQFRFTPRGKHLIRVCHGTACHVNGAPTISDQVENILGIKNGETTPDGKFSMENVACLGCCSLAPVMMIDDTTYGRLTRKKVEKILKEY